MTDAHLFASRDLEQGRPLGFQRRRPPQFAVPDHAAAGAALAAAGRLLSAASPHSRGSPASSAGPFPLCPLPPTGHPEAAVGPLRTGYRRRLRPEAAAEHQHLLHSSTQWSPLGRRKDAELFKTAQERLKQVYVLAREPSTTV
nr:uncharacterized protein LOC120976223 [Aegilops tauschii subsp. strangulata]